MRNLALIACLVAPAALAAPRIDSLLVKPNPAAFSGGKAPEVEVIVSVKRGQFDRGCDAAVDLGDGSRPRTVEFGVASARTVRHTYGKGGNFRVSAKGAGSTPCEGARDVTLTVTGAPAPAKKAEPKKKPAAKKKKPEPKKKGAEAPPSRNP